MKIVTLIIVLLIYAFSTIAQPCNRGETHKFLYANNIRPLFKVGGTMFLDSTAAGFVVNLKSMDPYVSTIFAGGLLMTAKDKANIDKYSVELYAQNDYSYLPYGANQPECDNWDQIWLIDKIDIETHVNDWKADNKIDSKIASIYSWPGIGNPYFSSYNNFDLPANLSTMAPFYDNNKDMIYNPDDGDYPAIKDFKSGKYAVPDQMLWYMFNDNAVGGSSDVKPLNMIIQHTAWEFTGNDKLLNNTVFTNHTFIYQGSDSLHDFKSGLFNDLDIGCPNDDYMGTARELSTIFGYNKDSLDGLNGITCSGTNTFKDDPGVQAVTFLSDSLSASFFWGNSAIGSNPTFSPGSPKDFVFFMNSEYPKGGHLLDNKGNETNYHYYGNPNKPDEWSMLTENTLPHDFRGFGVVKLGDLNPGDVKSLTAAYSYFNNPDLKSTPSDLDSMYAGVKRLHEIYDDFFIDYKVSTSQITQGDITIYPNPAKDYVTIKTDQKNKIDVLLLDIYGRVLVSKKSNSNSINLDISSLDSGSYIVKLESKGSQFSKKLIILK